MTTEATHQDPKSTASANVLIPDLLDASGEETGEIADADSEIEIDFSHPIFESENGDCYHRLRGGVVPACPTVKGKQSTLRTAAANGDKPCGVCNPPEYRNAAALLAHVAPEWVLVLRVEINDEKQAIFLRRDSQSPRFQTVRRIESGSPSDERRCDRTTALSLLNALTTADDFIGVEYGPVKKLWPSPDKQQRAGGDG